MDESRWTSGTFFVHRRQRGIESRAYGFGCRVSDHSFHPRREDLNESFDGIAEQVDQSNTQPRVFQQMDSGPEIVPVFLFHLF
jgi:hypothetical protein